MDVAFVNPFIASTINAFSTMLDMVVTPGKAILKQEPYPTYDVSGVIGLSGQAQGLVALSFPKSVALKVVSGMVGSTIKVVGPEMVDGIGELANIVAGSAKKDLAQYQLSISLPNVIIGKGHMLSSPKSAPALIVPFTSAMGNFTMEISLKTE